MTKFLNDNSPQSMFHAPETVELVEEYEALSLSVECNFKNSQGGVRKNALFGVFKILLE